MTNDLLWRITPRLPQGNTAPVLVAVSGGLDSMCLLHLLEAWGRKTATPVLAAHFNHQLRGDTALRDEAFVQAYCAQQDIPFFAGRGDTRAHAQGKGLTIEEAGRELRYAFLEEIAAAQGCAWMFTAHHADDNAETMLFHLLRGTGLAGLAGIPPVRGKLRRPLLEITRGELVDYAARVALPHIEDETNQEDAASRNVLRHRVLPVLRELNPQAAIHMSRTASLLAEADAALAACARSLSSAARETACGVSLSCQALCAAPAAIAQRAVLQLFASVSGAGQDWTAAHITAVLALAAKKGDSGSLSLPYGLMARREKEILFLEHAPVPPQIKSLSISGATHWGDWEIICEKKQRRGLTKHPALLLSANLPTDEITVGPWRSGDGLVMGRGRRSLKRLFAQHRVAPALRETWPVIYVAGRAVAILGIAVDADFAPVVGSEILEITARRSAGYEKKETDDE